MTGQPPETPLSPTVLHSPAYLASSFPSFHLANLPSPSSASTSKLSAPIRSRRQALRVSRASKPTFSLEGSHGQVQPYSPISELNATSTLMLDRDLQSLRAKMDKWMVLEEDETAAADERKLPLSQVRYKTQADAGQASLA